MNTQTKKILIFSSAYYPKHVGGAEVAIKEIADRVDPSEIVFHMITNRFDSSLPKVEQVGNVLVHRVGFAKRNAHTAATHHPLFYIQKILFPIQASLKARKLSREYQYDGFWAMMLYMLFPIVLLRLRGFRKPYALTLQEGDTFEHVFSRWFLKPFRPLLVSGIKNAKVVQTISNFLAAWPKQFGYEGDIVVIPNAVDTKLFSENISSEMIAKAQNALGKKPGEVFLVTTSRLVKKNAVDDVIRALTNLPQSVQFVVFGEGPEESELRTLAGSLGVTERVHFKGHIDRKDMPSNLKACDIFIRPSRSEGFGVSFVEAMAAGLPVIATQEGGIADFLFDRNRNLEQVPTGFVVEKNKPEQIATQVEYILGHEGEVRETVENAKKMVEERYDWNIIARDMSEKVFSRL